MAVRHVSVVERVFGLSNRCAAGEATALTELISVYHEDARVESHLSEARGDTRGETAIREYFEAVAESYDAWECILDYVQDFGDRVLALGALRSVARSGAHYEHAVGWIFTFRGDKIEAVQAYPSYGDALRAATSRTSLAR